MSLVTILLDRYGRTFAEEVGIELADAPQPLYQWLTAVQMFSIRITAELAVRGIRAVFAAGWTTPEAMLAAEWGERVLVLNHAGYARYDESTATALARNARLLLDRWGGDLRRLRDEADRDAAQERALLQKFTRVGPVAADIFCREAQAVWPELYPSADRKALTAARALGLAETPEALAALVPREQFPRLVAGLVRVRLAKAEHVLSELARS